jgi:hypothetical protein
VPCIRAFLSILNKDDFFRTLLDISFSEAAHGLIMNSIWGVFFSIFIPTEDEQ